MSKPAKTYSYRAYIEEAIRNSTSFEDIDILLKHTPKSKRADYLIENRSIIIEQKEYLNSPQHNAKGKAYYDFIEKIYVKYGINPDDLDSLSKKFELLNEDEKEINRRLRDNFYDKIKDLMRKANKQIGSTKRILNLGKSAGSLLIVFDKILGIIPNVVRERVIRSIDLFEHIDVVVYAIHLEPFLYNGMPVVHGMVEKLSSGLGVETGRKIRDIIRDKSTSRSGVISNDDIVTQLKDHFFD